MLLINYKIISTEHHSFFVFLKVRKPLTVYNKVFFPFFSFCLLSLCKLAVLDGYRLLFWRDPLNGPYGQLYTASSLGNHDTRLTTSVISCID